MKDKTNTESATNAPIASAVFSLLAHELFTFSPLLYGKGYMTGFVSCALPLLLHCMCFVVTYARVVMCPCKSVMY